MGILSCPAGCTAEPTSLRAVLNIRAFAEKLGQAWLRFFSDSKIEAVVSPAMGGLIIGQKSRPAGAGSSPGVERLTLVERDASGMMTLRRGFLAGSRQHVLVVEDVWTRAGQRRKPFASWKSRCRVVAAGALIDRSGGKIDFGSRAQSLSNCPLPATRRRLPGFVAAAASP